MIHDPQNESRTIQDRSWDLLTEMWMSDQADRITKEIVIGEHKSIQQDMDEFFASRDGIFLKQIEKMTKSSLDRRMLIAMMRKIANWAAIIIIVITIVGSSAIATSATIRINLVKFLIEQTPEFTSLSLVEDEGRYVDVPVEWRGEYYPESIPMNLVITDMYCSNEVCRVTYSLPNDGEWQFVFEEMAFGTMNLDSEDAEITYVEVNGHNATMIVKSELISIYWFDGTKLLLIDLKGCSREEALVYASSVRRIQ